MIKVVLVDDDPLVRAGLKMILGGAEEITVVAEASNGLEGLDAVTSADPDVVLMDVRMPRLDGISATTQLMARPRRPHVIVLTTFDTDDLIVEALRAGASGFLLKDTDPAALVQAVRDVAAGDPILSPSVTRLLVDKVTASQPANAAAVGRLDSLTEREAEVAALVGIGASNNDIARQLHMSLQTVKTHVSRVLAKLGVENRVQAALIIHDAGRAQPRD